MKKIMILGASILQVPAIKKAKEMGLQVFAVDMNKDAVGFQYADICLVISTIDIPGVVKAAVENKIDGIMTLASDMPMRAVAAVVEEMELAGIDKKTAVRATNKAVMRQSLRDHNVPIPKFIRVGNREEYEDAVKQFSDKFIVKPVDNSGSRGIYLIENIHDASKIRDAYTYSRASSRSGDVVVEDYMCGREISVETISVDGQVHVIQITDKLTTGAPHFVETGHTQPADFPIDVIKKIREVATAAVKAIGIKNGPSHTEIMVTPDGPKIVELGARLGGDCITTHLVPLSTGVDMVGSCIEIALGEKPDITPKFSKGSAIRYFDSHAGFLTGIHGVEQAKKIEGVRQIDFVRKIGDRITDIQSSADRIGFVIAQGKDAAASAASCNAALRAVKIDISQVPNENKG